MPLPTDMTAFYNGVTFPVTSETTDVSITPVYDSSGRAVKYNSYQITIRAVFGQAEQEAAFVGLDELDEPGVLDDDTGAAMGETMDALRKRLTKPAGEFHYFNYGLGNFSINVPPDGPSIDGLDPGPEQSNLVVRDLVWGPKPRLMKWHPFGNKAAEVVWTVEVAIADCDTANHLFKSGFVEYNHHVSYASDKSGYGTRTLSGRFTIPQTRRSVEARTLEDHVDRYFDFVNPAVPTGYRRGPRRRSISEDRCSITFEFTDEEVGPNYPPPGAIEAQAAHTVSGSGPTPERWEHSLTATYEMARDRFRGDAVVAFNELLKDRLQGVRGGPPRRKGNDGFLTSYTFAEPEIYGRRCAQFTATWVMFANIVELLPAAGLWRHVPGGGWAKWATSLANTGFHPRGNTKLAYRAADDLIIDLCIDGDNPTPGYGELSRVPPPKEKGQLRLLRNEMPRRQKSWLKYECRIRIEEEDEVYELKPLPRGKPRNTPPGVTPPSPYTLSTVPLSRDPWKPPRPSPSPGDKPGFLGDGLKGPVPSPKPGGARLSVQAGDDGRPVVQVRAAPSVYAILYGHAYRAGYPVEAPGLVRCGGAPVVRACRQGEGVSAGLLGDYYGVNVYFARWNIRYLVTAPMTQPIELPDHPY